MDKQLTEGDTVSVTWLDAMTKGGWQTREAIENWTETPREEAASTTMGRVITVKDGRLFLATTEAPRHNDDPTSDRYQTVWSFPEEIVTHIEVNPNQSRSDSDIDTSD